MADRYLVECGEEPCSDFGTTDWKFKNAQVVKLWPNQDVFSTGSLLAMKCKAESDGREEGRNEAWTLAQKIYKPCCDGGYTVKEVRNIFGCVDPLTELSYKEAFDKVKAWEKTANIKIGDLVRVHSGNNHYDGRLALVIALREYSCERAYKVVFDDGDVSLYSPDAVDYIRTVGFNNFFSEKEE